MIVITLSYVPVLSFAGENEERIIHEIQIDNIKEIMQPETSFRTASVQISTYYFTGSWRSRIISLTRSSASNGITVVGNNYGSNPVAVCIFKRGGTSASDVIGPAKTIAANGLSTLAWTASELGSYTEIDVFFTMYKTATNYLIAQISY